jgi:hypothetical protein
MYFKQYEEFMMKFRQLKTDIKNMQSVRDAEIAEKKAAEARAARAAAERTALKAEKEAADAL